MFRRASRLPVLRFEVERPCMVKATIRIRFARQLNGNGKNGVEGQSAFLRL
jgi:hypothetical protein